MQRSRIACRWRASGLCNFCWPVVGTPCFAGKRTVLPEKIKYTQKTYIYRLISIYYPVSDLLETGNFDMVLIFADVCVADRLKQNP